MQQAMVALQMDFVQFDLTRRVKKRRHVAHMVQLESMLNAILNSPISTRLKVESQYIEWIGHENALRVFGNDSVFSKSYWMLQISSEGTLNYAHLVGQGSELIFFTYDRRPGHQLSKYPVMIAPTDKDDNVIFYERFAFEKESWDGTLPELPIDILYRIFHYLHPAMLLQCRMVSKTWRFVAEQDVYYMRFVQHLRQRYALYGFRFPNKAIADCDTPTYHLYITHTMFSASGGGSAKWKRKSIDYLSRYENASLLLYVVKMFIGSRAGTVQWSVEHNQLIRVHTVPTYKARVVVKNTNGTPVLWIPPKAPRLWKPDSTKRDGRSEIDFQDFITPYKTEMRRIVDSLYVSKQECLQ